jgi:hypothetical protein
MNSKPDSPPARRCNLSHGELRHYRTGQGVWLGLRQA